MNITLTFLAHSARILFERNYEFKRKTRTTMNIALTFLIHNARLMFERNYVRKRRAAPLSIVTFGRFS